MRLPIVLGEPFMLLVLGLGLEIVAGLSQKWDGVLNASGVVMSCTGLTSIQGSGYH